MAAKALATSAFSSIHLGNTLFHSMRQIDLTQRRQFLAELLKNVVPSVYIFRRHLSNSEQIPTFL